MGDASLPRAHGSSRNGRDGWPSAGGSGDTGARPVARGGGRLVGSLSLGRGGSGRTAAASTDRARPRCPRRHRQTPPPALTSPSGRAGEVQTARALLRGRTRKKRAMRMGDKRVTTQGAGGGGEEGAPLPHHAAATLPPEQQSPPSTAPPPTTYNHTAQWKRRETPNGNGVYQPPPTSYLPLPTPPSPHPLFLRPPPKQNSWPQYETRAASGWGVGGKKVGQERVVPPTRPPSHTINGSIAPHERASSHANVSTDTYTHTRKRIQQGIRRVGGEREGGGA